MKRYFDIHHEGDRFARAAVQRTAFQWMVLPMIGLSIGCGASVSTGVAADTATQVAADGATQVAADGATEPRINNGKIDAVTVYRDRASVVRSIPIRAAQGLQRIRVTGLPQGLIVDSAQATCDAGTTVRWLRIGPAESLSPEAAQQIKLLDDAHTQLIEQLTTAQQSRSVIDQDLLTIEKMGEFASDKVEQNLDRATLDVQAVSKLADYVIERRRELAKELFAAERENEQITRQIETNRSKHRALHQQSATRGFEALMALDSPEGGSVQLAYQVTGVSWEPRYTIRGTSPGGNDNKSRFQVQLSGVVVQNSGEDWQNVGVTFSSAKPAQQAAGPALTPLRVQVDAANADQRRNASATSLSAGDQSSDWQDPEVWQRDIQLNTQAAMRQVNELRYAGSVEREMAPDAGQEFAEESYRVAERLDIDNRPESQTVVIADNELEGELYQVATPLLSSFAFREAKIENTLPYNLVASPAIVFLDNQFIGQTTLPPTVSGQPLLIGFGPNRQLRTRRELMSQHEKIVGGNRLTEFEYRLVVSNYSSAPVNIRLVDRLPIAADDGAITVQLASAADKQLSLDPLYIRMRKPKGVLRWDVTVPGKTFGSAAFDFEYAFTLEMDRQKTVTTQSIGQLIQDDYRFHRNNGGMGGMGGGMGGMGGGGAF